MNEFANRTEYPTIAFKASTQQSTKLGHAKINMKVGSSQLFIETPKIDLYMYIYDIYDFCLYELRLKPNIFLLYVLYIDFLCFCGFMHTIVIN